MSLAFTILCKNVSTVSVYAPLMGWGWKSNGEIDSLDNENFFVGGDFNTDYDREGVFLDALNDSLVENKLVEGDQKESKKVTFMSKIKETPLWIDNFLVSKQAKHLPKRLVL